MERDDGLEAREAAERLEAILASAAAEADAAKGGSTPPPASQFPRKTCPARRRFARRIRRAVTRPDGGEEALAGAVRDADRVLLCVEGDDDLDRTQDLVARQRMIGRDVREGTGAM